VVGGGDAAIEAAIALEIAARRCTSRIAEKFSNRIKPKNQERLDAAAAASKVSVLYEAQVKEIRSDVAVLGVGAAPRELPNDYVLIFAGECCPRRFSKRPECR